MTTTKPKAAARETTSPATSPDSVPYPPGAAQVPAPKTRDGYLEIGDIVRMTCGPHQGRTGWVLHTGIRGSTVPALSVYLWQQDIEIITVLSHVRRARCAERKAGVA